MQWLRSLFGPSNTMLRSSVCRQADFETAWYKGLDINDCGRSGPFAARIGSRLGCRVGRNAGPLVARQTVGMGSYLTGLGRTRNAGRRKARHRICRRYRAAGILFASRGATIVASDYLADEGGWGDTGQNAKSFDAVRWPKLVDQVTFERNVRFHSQDMRNLSNLPSGSFDFAWSSCSLEHLGSLQAGMEFLQASLDLLKPGGIAVHTTEYNVNSNEKTIEIGNDVIYRRRDLDDLAARLKSKGHKLEPLDLDTGSDEHDTNYDRPPFYLGGYQHVKLLIGEYVSTSIILIVRRSL